MKIVRDLADASEVGPTQLGRNTGLRSAGFDSLMMVELVARLEDEFHLELPDQYLSETSLATPTAISALILELLR